MSTPTQSLKTLIDTLLEDSNDPQSQRLNTKLEESDIVETLRIISGSLETLMHGGGLDDIARRRAVVDTLRQSGKPVSVGMQHGYWVPDAAFYKMLSVMGEQ